MNMLKCLAVMVAAALLCALPVAAQDGEPETIEPITVAIIEDAEADPQTLNALHSELSTQGFSLVRALSGRLEGRGNLWSAPDGMTLEGAQQATAGLDGVVETLDAPLNPPPDQRVYEGRYGYEVVAGQIMVKIKEGLRIEVVDYLESRGFVFLWAFASSELEQIWGFLPIEYSVEEAVDLVEKDLYSAHYISWVCPNAVFREEGVTCFLPGDVSSDGRVSILDLIAVRNQIGKDPFSDPGAMSADVNFDGKVNILDLIFVRNHMNESCDDM